VDTSNDFATRVESSVATIEINRPNDGNALTRGHMLKLAELLRTMSADPATHVIAIAGRGPEFCRGRDGRGETRTGMSAYDVRMKLLSATISVYDAIAAAPVPVVACVHGKANGFGAALAAACDVTLSSDAARYRFGELEHGIAPTMAMAACMNAIPQKALAYLVYSGEEIGAAQALAYGLASAIFPHAQFAAESDTFLKKLAAKSRPNLETIKRFQLRAGALSGTARGEYAADLLALVRSSEGA